MKSVQREASTQQQKHTQRIDSLRPQENPHLVEDARKHKILVIEDDEDTCECLSQIFRMEQFKVISATGGRRGIDLAEAERPDGIIVDVNLPQLSGIDVIKILRRQPEFSQSPIVAITAYGQWATTQAILAGANLALLKPIKPDELIAVVRQLLTANPAPE